MRLNRSSQHAPIDREIVLIGGGHAHVGVIRKFAMQAEPGVRLTLISRDIDTPYSGMLPGLIAGHYTHAQAHINLLPLCRFAKARFYHTQVEGLDLDKQHVIVPNRPPVYFDLLSINSGSTPTAEDIPGVSEHALAVKPVDAFLEAWQALIPKIVANTGDFRIIIVGGGAGGVEVALAIQHRLNNLLKEKDRSGRRLTISIVTRDREILSSHNPGVRARFKKILHQRGIEVHAEQSVVEVKKNAVLTASGREFASDSVIWVTHASAPLWPKSSNLALDDRGFILLNEHLQSISHDNVFAAGDVAALASPRPKSGVFAVRQGPVLAKNLRLAARGKPLAKYRPQNQFLSLISTGDAYAVASRGSWSLQGKWLWTAKDWIDRSFMRQYQQLPAMPSDRMTTHTDARNHSASQQTSLTTNQSAMRCGGCGGKVGSDVLHRVLDKLPSKQRADVVISREHAEDAVMLSIDARYSLVQSVDYFRSFLDDHYTFGAIAANHALNDLYAMGAEAQSALAIATLPYASQAITEQTLYELLMGALSVLHSSDAVLSGGHSSEGAELAFGLSVNGLVAKGKEWRKTGLQIGDALIATKAVGTGTLFAADMRAQARGDWLENAVESMLLSNRQAAITMRDFSIHACTDITGFGLAGHLIEMLQASKLSANLNLDSISALTGAVETASRGYLSSLQPENRNAEKLIDANPRSKQHSLYSLLFDPQTAGGLLFGVPNSEAASCLHSLHCNGYAGAAVIGVVTDDYGSDFKIKLS